MDSSAAPTATFSFMKASSSYSSLFPFSPTPNTKQHRLFVHKSQFFKSLKCSHSSSPDSNPTSFSSSNTSPFACSAVTFSPSPTTDLVPDKLRHLIAEFNSLPQPIDRVKRLLHYATLLPQFPDSSRIDSNRVMGCTAQVWLEAELDQYGKMRFSADSDSEITRGFCACLVWMLDGATPEEVVKAKPEDLAALNVGLPGGERSRVNTWHNVLVSMQKKAKKLVAEREGKKPFEPFPSLIVSANGVEAKGSYAEAQVK